VATRHRPAPIFNERYVIERLVEAISRFDYPREILDVQVLDDSTDETCEVAKACVDRHAAAGMPITYIHRTNREGYKAGALENGLKTSRGEFVAIFDADFIPTRLLRTVPYFLDGEAGKNIGMVQTRWTYLNRDYSLLTQVKRFFSTATSSSNTAPVPAAELSLISTAPPESGAAPLSTLPADGSMTHSPKTPTFPTAPNSKAGNSSISQTSSAPPNYPST